MLILLMSNNLGATIIAFLVVTAFLIAGRWVQVLLAMGIGFIIFLFPIFRGAGLIPVDQVTEAVSIISEDRALSFGFRLANEDISLEHAMEKPITGWGGWGRNQVFDDRGEMISIQEGAWILAITENGWYGYVGLFGLLTLPSIFIIGVWRRKAIPPETFALIGITTGNLIYMVPTPHLTSLSWLVFGAVAGYMLTPAQEAKASTAPADPPEPVSPYTRFAGNRVLANGRQK